RCAPRKWQNSCNKHCRHPEELARLRRVAAAPRRRSFLLRTAAEGRLCVSKGGHKLGACFHPSRRPLACASGLLRMTVVFVARFVAAAWARAPIGALS